MSLYSLKTQPLIRTLERHIIKLLQSSTPTHQPQTPQRQNPSLLLRLDCFRFLRFLRCGFRVFWHVGFIMFDIQVLNPLHLVTIQTALLINPIVAIEHIKADLFPCYVLCSQPSPLNDPEKDDVSEQLDHLPLCAG